MVFLLGSNYLLKVLPKALTALSFKQHYFYRNFLIALLLTS